MKELVDKALHTLRKEGVVSLVNRTGRFAVYKGRRLLTHDPDNLRRWAELQDRHHGQRAFLIGNGPSLNKTELHLLGDEFTICFNRWDLMLERLPWTPNFYAVIDDRVLLDTLDVANDMATRVDAAFFPDIHPYNVTFRGRIHDAPNVHWLYLDLASFSDRLPFCGINKTVANVGLQVLAYLGFTEIYLLGVDMQYSIPQAAVLENKRDIVSTADDDESHFDPRYFGKGRKFHVPMLDETFERFRVAREFFGARGVKIYNATVGGALETFPRVALNDVLQLSNQERHRRFTETVRLRLRDQSFDVIGGIETELVTEVDNESLAERAAFAIDVEQVDRFIRRWVYDFVPFGPNDGRYLFVKRTLLNPVDGVGPAGP